MMFAVPPTLTARTSGRTMSSMVTTAAQWTMTSHGPIVSATCAASRTSQAAGSANAVTRSPWARS